MLSVLLFDGKQWGSGTSYSCDLTGKFATIGDGVKRVAGDTIAGFI
jgi:hypothetical protein